MIRRGYRKVNVGEGIVCRATWFGPVYFHWHTGGYTGGRWWLWFRPRVLDIFGRSFYFFSK